MGQVWKLTRKELHTASSGVKVKYGPCRVLAQITVTIW